MEAEADSENCELTLGHLAEDQDPVPAGLQLRQDPVEHVHLALRDPDARISL